MATSNNADNFFQTTSSLAENERKTRKSANTFGEPVKFSTKLLSIGIDYLSDSGEGTVYVAAAGGEVTGLRLSTNTRINFPSGPQAPLTSLAFYKNTIFAGCWDKSIWKYATDVSSFPAHIDFVKCLAIAVTADKQTILLSGSADDDLRFWSLEGKSLGAFKPMARSIECIVADPFASPDSPTIMLSTSRCDIIQLALPGASQLSSIVASAALSIPAHETSVYKLHFDSDGDLWTASADKTSKRLVRENGWQADTTLQHPDFVRDVITHDKYGLVLTACRDEEVRVWDKASGELRHVFTGHYEEVTGLALSGDLLISISIDATLRRWSLAPQDLRKAIEAAKAPDLAGDSPEPNSHLGMLTAEEEAELRALMEDEEADTLEKMAADEQ